LKDLYSHKSVWFFKEKVFFVDFKA
jgi:hypothetical protein